MLAFIILLLFLILFFGGLGVFVAKVFLLGLLFVLFLGALGGFIGRNL